jgi:hypothetical protein
LDAVGDVIRVMVAVTAILVPIPFIMKRPKKAAPVAMGH